MILHRCGRPQSCICAMWSRTARTHCPDTSLTSRPTRACTCLISIAQLLPRILSLSRAYRQPHNLPVTDLRPADHSTRAHTSTDCTDTTRPFRLWLSVLYSVRRSSLPPSIHCCFPIARPLPAAASLHSQSLDHRSSTRRSATSENSSLLVSSLGQAGSLLVPATTWPAVLRFSEFTHTPQPSALNLHRRSPHFHQPARSHLPPFISTRSTATHSCRTGRPPHQHRLW
jgi:hypothetical protein